MAISFMADNGVSIPCARDAAIYDLIGNGENYVVGGIGNELSLNHNATSRTVTLTSGIGVIRGRHVQITGTESLTLGSSTSGFIVLEYDLSQTGANICKLKSVTSVTNGNINNGDNISDLVIGQYTTSGTGVSAYTDLRKIYTGTIAQKTSQIKYGTADPVVAELNEGDVYLKLEV